jgi:hypothetical protein
VTFSSAALDFTNSNVTIGGVAMGNQTLLGKESGPIDDIPIANFLSSYNVVLGYAPFGNPAVIRECDTATVTLPELAQLVGTLISDLKALQLPAD